VSIRLDHGEDALGEIHDINVTPFIDVILVLLIIFMIAAPLATVDVAVDLPTSNVERQPRPDKPIFLTIKSDLSLAIGDSPVSRGALQSSLDALSDNDRSMRIFLRADKSVPYGDLMEAMNALRTAGYLKVALVGLESDAGR
jgi:biopolymer transport protein ExbD